MRNLGCGSDLGRPQAGNSARWRRKPAPAKMGGVADTRRSSCTSTSRARSGRATLLDIAARNGVPLPADTVEGLERALRVHRLRALHRGLDPDHQRLRTADDFRQVVVDYAAEAASLRRGLPRGDLLAGRAGRARAELGRHLRGLLRRRDEAAEQYGVDGPAYARPLPRLPTRAGRGVSRGTRCATATAASSGSASAGSRRGFPPRALRSARSRSPGTAGSGSVPHAGEVAGPDSIREALARSTPTASATASARSTTRTCSPSSSTAGSCSTSARPPTCAPAWCASLAEHPLPRCVAAGVPAPSTPTTRRCSAPTSAASTSSRPASGSAPRAFVRAGLARSAVRRRDPRRGAPSDRRGVRLGQHVDAHPRRRSTSSRPTSPRCSTTSRARYDLTNDVLSLGQDRRWRRRSLEAVDARAGRAGARPRRRHRHVVAAVRRGGRHVVPCDFSLGMLRVGQGSADPRAAASSPATPCGCRSPTATSTPSRSRSACATSPTRTPRCARCCG